jgi:hypothetical protein
MLLFFRCGGKPKAGKGYYVEPTVFTDVKDSMKISREEIFGPVQCISKWSKMDEVGYDRSLVVWKGFEFGWLGPVQCILEVEQGAPGCACRGLQDARLYEIRLSLLMIRVPGCCCDHISNLA